MLATLIATILYTTYNLIINYLASTLVTLTVISTLAAISKTEVKITIAIINLYKTQLFLFFGLNIGFLSLLDNPQPTILSVSFSTQYLYLTG
jgi:hypothetical protein